MRVLYISYDGATDPLGCSQILPYLKGLSKRGSEFTLLSFEKRKRLKDKKQLHKIKFELCQNKIQWIALKYHKRPPVLSTLYDVLKGTVISWYLINNKRIGIIHARSYVPALIAFLFKKLLGIKFIFDMRGFWADERVEGRLWHKKGSLYNFTKLLEKYFIKNADDIIVLTKAARAIIKNWGYDVSNVSVIPCCVDTNDFVFDIESRIELRKRHNLNGKFIFVHTGSLEYWYMIEEMLNYFRVAKEAEPSAHFLILTHSGKNKILKSVYDKNLNPEDFTILSVSYVDMPKYLSMADAGLIFITPVFSKKASSPTKFAEYLSCALPVIINERIGDLESYVVKNNIGVVIRDFNNNQYRQTFKRLLNLLKDGNLKFRCKKVVCDNFSLNTGIDKYYQVYSRL